MQKIGLFNMELLTIKIRPSGKYAANKKGA